MHTPSPPVLSVVVPLYNEAPGLRHFYESLTPMLRSLGLTYELILVDDGSVDGSGTIATSFAKHDQSVRVLKLSRNFGKEIAVTAGMHRACGEAVLILDADGQHPVEVIPQFVAAWQAGAKVVIGRRMNRQTGLLKKVGSKLFYGLFKRVTGIKTDLEANDFRLIDHEVQLQFNALTEHNRIARGLIDWLGYERVYIDYKESGRIAGNSTYSLRKLTKLAVDSAISHSISPLHITAYVGAFVLPTSVLLGLCMVINALLGDPLNLNITGGGYVMVCILFLVGMVLVSQGIIGLYLSHIHSETQNRPLYIVDESKSRGWDA